MKRGFFLLSARNRQIKHVQLHSNYEPISRISLPVLGLDKLYVSASKQAYFCWNRSLRARVNDALDPSHPPTSPHKNSQSINR